MSFFGIREILFATDFSVASSSAAQAAVSLAQRLGARLHVLHVADPEAAATAFRMLDELTTRLVGPSTISIVKAVETGRPAVEITKYAARNAIDLVVMGTHGRTGARHLLRGSVAEAVVRTAPCPVLTVKAAPATTVESPEPKRSAPALCLLCARPSGEAICDPCSKRVIAEARERKLRELRA